MDSYDLVGSLVIAHPLYPERDLKRSVVLVTGVDGVGQVGICINKPFVGVDFNTVMSNAGLSSGYDEPLYRGGEISTNRVFVVHSLDWSSPSTVMLTKDIGLSTDLSILAAISQCQGPEYFRACAGYYFWEGRQLLEQTEGVEPWGAHHMWSHIPATIENLFEVEAEVQWFKSLDSAAKLSVSAWF